MRWKDTVARGSKITANNYFRILKNFCIQNNIQPEDLIKKDVKELQNFLDDNVTRLESEGKAGSSIGVIIVAVKSWLAHNEIKLNRTIKISKSTRNPTIENERVPTQEELKSIINQASVRGRASIALMSQSGVRPQVLGNGEDGLRISDLPDLEVTDSKYSFKKTPAMINVRADLSKADHKYLTFLSSEGCEYVLAHLQERIRNGEEIGQESPLIGYGVKSSSSHFKKSGSIFLSQVTTMKEVRIAIRKAGFNLRPYVLRPYFASMLFNAETKGKITHSTRQFFMGHKGDMESVYTTNKGRLPEDMIDGMRKAYKDSENYLMTTPRQDGIQGDVEQFKVEMMKNMYKFMFGEEDKKFSQLFDHEREKDLGRPLTDKEYWKFVAERKKELEESGQGEYKVVEVGELEDFLKENSGWKPLQTVNHDKFLVKKG